MKSIPVLQELPDMGAELSVLAWDSEMRLQDAPGCLRTSYGSSSGLATVRRCGMLAET